MKRTRIAVPLAALLLVAGPMGVARATGPTPDAPAPAEAGPAVGPVREIAPTGVETSLGELLINLIEALLGDGDHHGHHDDDDDDHGHGHHDDDHDHGHSYDNGHGNDPDHQPDYGDEYGQYGSGRDDDDDHDDGLLDLLVELLDDLFDGIGLTGVPGSRVPLAGADLSIPVPDPAPGPGSALEPVSNDSEFLDFVERLLEVIDENTGGLLTETGGQILDLEESLISLAGSATETVESLLCGVRRLIATATSAPMVPACPP